MELGLSEEQALLQETLRQLCEDRFPLEALRRTEAEEDGFPREFWDTLCELGVPGIAIAERFGGLGMGLLECALVHEQLGRFLVPTPHFVSSILAAEVIARSGEESWLSLWLPGIADGSHIMTVATLESGVGHDLSAMGAELTPLDEGARLSGTKHFVPFASVADDLLVLARNPKTGAVTAAIVPREAEGVSIRRQESLATEPCFEIAFDDVVVGADRILSGDADIGAAWHGAMCTGLVVLAAQAVGAAQHIHEISTAYAKEREAFGRPIGGFQAIAHYLADAIVEIEGCRTLVYQAAWRRDNGRAYQSAAAIAKLQACAMFRRVSALGIQVHGGLGYTIEADPQLFFRRAKQWQLLNWDDAFLEEEIARLTIDEEPERV
ncbi:acyl-CoA dehydrogenase family protein [Parasphingopyxis marina]|uniref:Acyl-CoA/acyl-ACP dehydrogenase n=1 Tax=Parasphingopyxis marina TaxID=2761622 RepID=A0A842I477_9SPHN|nr:acyl-CoA dehydrogenase family protein [Parasphingopyxis marina]MBC2778964.1 acyl-CoA/acyl-ACP dehydrogenase [Parasphingopyxis marina]